MEFVEVKGKTVEDAITQGLVELGATSDQVEYEVIEKGTNGLFGLGSKQAVIKIRKNLTLEDELRHFLAEILRTMNIDAEIIITHNEDEKTFDIELKGTEMAILIGKRGQTLDSLQYLLNLFVNKNSDKYIKVKLDTEGYRRKRKESLEILAKNIAYKVKKTNRLVKLEAMNPFERRIIHSALQHDKFISTYSDGEEPFRHVVIAPKKAYRKRY
ncbi:DNA/RNA-binding protein [Clostridia bacterium]|nr:DNA/RNA-binding protein [Clostridia bacterium]